MMGEIEAGLHQHLLQEGVADLHGRAQLLEAGVRIGAGGETGGAVNTVAARVGADKHEDVARAFRLRARQAIDGRNSDAHGVNEWVGGIGVFEDDFATDGRDAEAVPIAGDAGNDTAEEITIAGDICILWLGASVTSRVSDGAPTHRRWGDRAEAKRVEDGDGTRAHREDIADDAADAGGGALVGLDGGRMVV